MSGIGKSRLGLLLLSALLVPLVCQAVASTAGNNANAPLDFGVKVPPVFRIIRSTPVAGGQQLRVWTNMRRVRVGSKEYTFRRVGEATIFVPSSDQPVIVHGL